jgi:hypothetical protein
MVILTHKKQEADEPIYIETLINNARTNQNIPNGKLPGLFKGKPAAQLLSQGNSRQLAIDDKQPFAFVRVANLISCAAVIYFSKQNAKAWIFHANVGQVLLRHVESALTNLGQPNAADLLVVYAQPGWEEDYEDDTKYMLEKGITENNILIIPDIPSRQFGIDNRGNIGQ